MANTGKIKQIIGPVVDVMFENNALPEIYSALELKRDNGDVVVLEVQQHLGEDSVRTVAMDATEGLMRGMTVVILVFLSQCLSESLSKVVCLT